MVLVLVLDLESCVILHAQEGKDAAALAGFLLELKRGNAPIKVVEADMSEAYASAVREVFGDRVGLVHDPCHVTALANTNREAIRPRHWHGVRDPRAKPEPGSRYSNVRPTVSATWSSSS